MRYSQSTSIETSTIGDRVVLYDCVSRKAVVLNPTGTLLWHEMKTPRDAAQLAQFLQARFPQIEAAQLQNDVETCLHDLMQQQLLRSDA